MDHHVWPYRVALLLVAETVHDLLCTFMLARMTNQDQKGAAVRTPFQ